MAQGGGPSSKQAGEAEPEQNQQRDFQDDHERLPFRRLASIKRDKRSSSSSVSGDSAAPSRADTAVTMDPSKKVLSM
jgi:hypothetical protein